MKKSLGQRIRGIFSRSPDTEEFFEELEDVLIEADLGSQYTADISDRLRSSARFNSREDVISALKEFLLEELSPAELGLDARRLNVLLVLGVNGVGKTTNLAKLAFRLDREWDRPGVVLAAGDTFRAAAVEQIAMHAERLDLRLVRQTTGADAGAVIYDAVTSARSRGEKVVLADTAGRMHNRKDLVKELEKIDGIVKRQAGGDVVYRKILVLDATTGQNALQQAEVFRDAVGIDAVLLAKYDSSARGGILLPVSRRLGLSCAWLGTGERYEDLVPFDPRRYVDELLAP